MTDATMDDISITFRLDDLFEPDEKEKLKKLFKKSNNEDSSEDEGEVLSPEELMLRSEKKLADDMHKIIKSAICEYKQMFLGMGLPTRAEEIQQYRLYYLIEQYFKEMPSEEKVSAMFQLTSTKSRSLIRSVMTRFRYNLDEIIKENLQNILESADIKEDNNCYFVIQSTYALEEFKNVIANKAPRSGQIRRVKDTSRTFYVSKESYKALCDYFDLEVEFAD